MELPEYGWLREKVESDEGRAKIAKAVELGAIAADLGAPLAQLALAWCLVNPNVSTVILGASRPSQLEENLAALELVPKLTEDVLERIETILDNKPKLPETF